MYIHIQFIQILFIKNGRKNLISYFIHFKVFLTQQTKSTWYSFYLQTSKKFCISNIFIQIKILSINISIFINYRKKCSMSVLKFGVNSRIIAKLKQSTTLDKSTCLCSVISIQFMIYFQICTDNHEVGQAFMSALIFWLIQFKNFSILN